MNVVVGILECVGLCGKLTAKSHLPCIRVGDFFLSVWDRRREILCSGGSACEVGRINPAPEMCEFNGIECAMAVESEQLIYFTRGKNGLQKVIWCRDGTVKSMETRQG